MLFSQRAEHQKSSPASALVYDDVPPKLRVQVSQIARAALGPAIRRPGTWGDEPERGHMYSVWTTIRDVLRKEYGRHSLASRTDDPQAEVLTFFERTTEGLEALDVVELVAGFIVASEKLSNGVGWQSGITQHADEAIQEINQRFQQNNCGYRVSGEHLVRIDSHPLDAEVVAQASQLLSGPGFEGPNQEFDKALKLHREGKAEDGIAYALKAFESTLKAIGKQRGWADIEKQTASRLIDAAFQSDLLPTELKAHFTAIRATLQAGAPTVRNNFGGHGQGPEVRRVPTYMAAYAIHIAGAAIVLLAQSHSASHATT